MKIFLIRHGESIQNVGKGDNINDADIYLTDSGKKQVEATGEKLVKYLKDNKIKIKDARMWVSPYFRTEQTAKILNQYLEIESVFQDPRLVEKDFGNFDGIDQSKWKDIDPVTLKTMNNRYDSSRGKFYTRLPNGESPFDVYNRVSTFIETIFRDDKDPLFIISHGDTIKCFLMRWLHKDLNWYYETDTSMNASVIMLYENKDGKYDCKTII